MTVPVQRRLEIIDQATRALISKRYKTVTKAINREFWGTASDVLHSRYVGSYGRGTATETSDIDIMVILPESEYNRYNGNSYNGQSRLLQAVRNAIKNTYSTSDVRADGQVVKIAFSDGMRFEILPAFKENNYLGNTVYRYPDSNMGGNWRSTNPLDEQSAMKTKNETSRGLLLDTCKHLRFIRDNYFNSYHLSGIVIDSFVYRAMGNWRWSPSDVPSAPGGAYESVLLRYWEDNYGFAYGSLNAPGSMDEVAVDRSRDCMGKVLSFIS